MGIRLPFKRKTTMSRLVEFYLDVMFWVSAHPDLSVAIYVATVAALVLL